MLYLGDCLEVLRTLPENSVDACVTDPPAGIAFMGKSWDSDKGGRDEWIKWLSEIFTEVHRVLKPGAHGLVWAIPRTSHWTATALENSGFQVRDVLVHLFGSGFPKSLSVGKAIDKAAGAEREIVGYDASKARPNKEGFAKVTSSIKTVGNEGHKDNGATVTAPATDAAKQWEGWGTSLKPASEHWILIKKPISERTIALNVQRWGTGALNIDQSRIPANNKPWEKEKTLCGSCAAGVGKKAKPLVLETKVSIVQENADTLDLEKELETLAGIRKADIGCFDGTKAESTDISSSTERFGKTSTVQSQPATLSTTSTKTKKTIAPTICSLCNVAITADTTSQSIQQKRPGTPSMLGALESKGRFPSNALLDERAAELLDEQSGFSKSPSGIVTGTKAIGGIMNNGMGRTESNTGHGDSGGASRFFMRFQYCAKSSRSERNAGLDGMPEKSKILIGAEGHKINPTTGRPVVDIPRANSHPCVKPLKLMQYLCRLITPPNGKILDPFMGSGSTGIAAKRLGFDFIGIELNPEYFEIATRRIENAKPDEVAPDPQLTIAEATNA